MSTPSFLWNSQSCRECGADGHAITVVCDVLIGFGVCPERSGTLTLGHKALLRLRARLAVRHWRHRVKSLPRPIASLWTIEVSQLRLALPAGVHCETSEMEPCACHKRSGTLKEDFKLSHTPAEIRSRGNKPTHPAYLSCAV
jgi:hypothetical protein